MRKKYSDYMDEITSDNLYDKLLGYGLFSNKIPPMFESESFGQYCKNHNPGFNDKRYDYIRYNTIRNINMSRQLGIPVPMSYSKLCARLKENWDNLKSHFHKYTDNQNYVISRNHIQLSKKHKELFEMNYDDWKNAGSPKDDLLIGKRYVAKADISTCFPSIYTHSISWALIGKENAKQRNRNVWYEKLDESCRNIKYGETHGLLIGPHTSNLISEVILTVVDNNLYNKGWCFIRNIDDYTCYIETREQAEEFITDLIEELGAFDLSLNHKKTKIENLPISSVEFWVRKLNGFNLLTNYGEVDYKHARDYFDLANELLESNGGNASVLNYAIKVLSKQTLTENAKTYCWKMSMHLCLLYPYLISLMDEIVFSYFDTPDEALQDFINKAYDYGFSKHNYEECSYAIYFAIKHDMKVEKLNISDIINSDDCILKTISYIYYKKMNDTDKLNILHEHALSLSKQEFDRN